MTYLVIAVGFELKFVFRSDTLELCKHVHHSFKFDIIVTLFASFPAILKFPSGDVGGAPMVQSGRYNDYQFVST